MAAVCRASCRRASRTSAWPSIDFHSSRASPGVYRVAVRLCADPSFLSPLRPGVLAILLLNPFMPEQQFGVFAWCVLVVFRPAGV